MSELAGLKAFGDMDIEETECQKWTKPPFVLRTTISIPHSPNINKATQLPIKPISQTGLVSDRAQHLPTSRENLCRLLLFRSCFHFH